ncbi:MAG: O-antigen ligase family protein [Planctomycetota bacterium]
MGFYAFVFLEPEWNWRWSIPRDLGFQKYIAVCVMIGFLLQAMRGNRFAGWFGYSVGALLSFLGLACVAAQFTINEYFTDFYLTTIAKVIVMAVITCKLVDTPKKAYMLLWLIVIGQGYNAFRINEQYFLDGYSLYAFRPWGWKGDNNLYSIFTVPAIAGSFALAVTSRVNWQRFLAATILVLQMHQMMLMESRGCMIGCIALFVFGLFMMPKNGYTIRLTVVAALAIAALAGPPVVKEFMSAFSPEGRRDSSAASRFKIWKAGYEITMDYPLLGVGPYAGQVLVPKYVPEYSHKKAKGLHNLLFEISTGCGIPAAICYFAFLLIPWYVAMRFYWNCRDGLEVETESCILALCVGVPGYLCSSMFSSGALLESSYVLVACGASAMCAINRNARTVDVGEATAGAAYAAPSHATPA